MDQNLLSEKLRELTEKYSVASQVRIGFEPGAITVSCDKGAFRFYYGFASAPVRDDMTNTPLLHWRLKRRYIELKNLLSQEMVKTPLAMRIHHIVPADDFTLSLQDTLFMETDLIQWICGGQVNRVFASMDNGYMNGILSTTDNVKASLELGVVPEGSQPVLLHEIIAKTGILSDVAADTQTQQYPIYVFNGSETKVYTDIDYELYGLSQSECDAVRYILYVLTDPRRAGEGESIAAGIKSVMEAAQESSKTVAYTPVKEAAHQ